MDSLCSHRSTPSKECDRKHLLPPSLPHRTAFSICDTVQLTELFLVYVAATEERDIGVDLDDTAPALATQVVLELDYGNYDGRDFGIRIPELAYHSRFHL